MRWIWGHLRLMIINITTLKRIIRIGIVSFSAAKHSIWYFIVLLIDVIVFSVWQGAFQFCILHWSLDTFRFIHFLSCRVFLLNTARKCTKLTSLKLTQFHFRFIVIVLISAATLIVNVLHHSLKFLFWSRLFLVKIRQCLSSHMQSSIWS